MSPIDPIFLTIHRDIQLARDRDVLYRTVLQVSPEFFRKMCILFNFDPTVGNARYATVRVIEVEDLAQEYRVVVLSKDEYRRLIAEQ